MNRSPAGLLTVVFVLGFIGCHGDGTPMTEPTPPASSSTPRLQLISVTPQNGTKLPADQVVQFLATLRYDFGDAASGTIELVVSCSKDGQMVCLDAGTIASPDSRQGDTTVSFSHRAPRGTQMKVQFSLVPKGAAEATASVSATYTVDAPPTKK